VGWPSTVTTVPAVSTARTSAISDGATRRLSPSGGVTVALRVAAAPASSKDKNSPST